jgi:hypothetical protein
VQLAAFLVAVLLLASSAWGQEERERPNASLNPRLNSMSESEAATLLVTALDGGLPQEVRADLYQLSSERSRLIVPALVSRLEAARKQQAPPSELMDLMADIVAYAGDEKAIDGLTALAVSDFQRFSPALMRVFDYALTRGNPFPLAYHAVGKGNAMIDALIVKWVAKNAEKGEGYSLLAEAVDRHHSGRAFETLTGGEDPFLQAVDDQGLSSIRRELTRIVSERSRQRK